MTHYLNKLPQHLPWVMATTITCAEIFKNPNRITNEIVFTVFIFAVQNFTCRKWKKQKWSIKISGQMSAAAMCCTKAVNLYGVTSKAAITTLIGCGLVAVDRREKRGVSGLLSGQALGVILGTVWTNAD